MLSAGDRLHPLLNAPDSASSTRAWLRSRLPISPHPIPCLADVAEVLPWGHFRFPLLTQRRCLLNCDVQGSLQPLCQGETQPG